MNSIISKRSPKHGSRVMGYSRPFCKSNITIMGLTFVTKDSLLLSLINYKQMQQGDELIYFPN